MYDFGKGGYVYIMSNRNRNVLYIGVTSDLKARAYQHRYEPDSLFTKRYKCKYLIYYEGFESIEEAILRERRMKEWKRNWKLRIIKEFNPNLDDLYDKIMEFD